MTAPDTLPPELAKLGELLREDPPRPSAAWARDLDARTAAGFPRPPRRSPWAIFKTHRRALVPVVSFACVALLVAGLSTANLSSEDSASSGGGGTGGAASSGSGGFGSAGRGESTAGGDSAGSGDSAESSPATSLARPKAPPAPIPPTGGSPGSHGRRSRAQERSAALTLAARPRQIERVAAGILRVTDATGGFVASSSVASGAGSGGSFELRIPNARLNRALADLSKLARVRERTQATQDITAETVSARGRLREARREREGLLRALANATTLNETEAVKARLRSVNARIASARSSVKRVANRAAYANVSVELVADRGGAAGPVDDGRWTPGDALRDAVRVLEVAAGVAVIVLALLLPLALLAGLGALASRMLGHRRRERALDMA